ncbi:MAG: hypothetical protein Q9196_003677 [Gyalolechia fulgens]
MRLNPGQKIRRVNPKLVNRDPFPDIYYVPPERWGTGWNPRFSTSRDPRYTQPYSHTNLSAETESRFRPPATATAPYKNPASRRYPEQQPPFPGQHQKSHFSTSSTRLNPVPSPSAEPIDIDQYHRLADTYIDKLVAKLEAIQEERDEVDCDYTAGVLTLAFPPFGTYVLNKQPPNRQIWLSSPISGPKRYDYVAVDPAETAEGSTGGDGASRGGAGVVGQEKRGGWVYLRDGSTLSEVLREELGVELDEEDIGAEELLKESQIVRYCILY